MTAAQPDRAANASGWYTAPVSVAFAGTDPTSGIASCSTVSYAGPDSGSVAVPGTCRDNAGNVSASGSFALKYDATPPKLENVKAVAGNRRTKLEWTASADISKVVVQRTPGSTGKAGSMVYQGKARSFTDLKLKNNVRYRYSVTALDEAGNAATAAVVALPRALVSPTEGVKLRTPPLFAWTAVPKASYYNVQLYRGRLKVLSTWPKGTSLKLTRSWMYAGRSYTLAPGRYRWYVWPGFGARSKTRYGPLLGGSFFFVKG